MMEDTGIRFSYKGEVMHLYKGQYTEPREAVALQLYSPDPDIPGNPLTPFMTASVNVMNANPEEVAIKNYSENEGILDVLIANKIVSEPLRIVKQEFVEIPICKLLV
jgi:hypothetical protein